MKKKFTPQFYITLLITLVLLFFLLKELYVKNNTKHNGVNIIAKFDSIQRFPKTTLYYFSYFSEGKKISTCNSGLKKLFEFNEITVIPNKFYKAKKNKNDPMIIIVNQEEQVTDTIAILAAGFSLEEIK